MAGKSVFIRAPSMFMNGLGRKAQNAGGHFMNFLQIQQSYLRLEVQRDLYSAFLAKCVNAETNSLDIERERNLWPCLEPSSFGITKGLPKVPACCEETVTEAVDAVIRGTSDENESHREVT
jgi:hypothetical protein